MSTAKSNQDEDAMLKVKVKCVMWNERIYGLTTNRSATLLLKEKQMRVLDAKEMESFFQNRPKRCVVMDVH
jgi:hypothetical protein